MQIVRPVKMSDLDALHKLAHLTGYGLTTLSRDVELLRQRIQESETACAVPANKVRGESYLFVLEDLKAGRVVGTSGIASKVGGFEPFYTYRVETVVHESKELGIKKEIKTLHLVTEHNGPCEIGSLFLHPEYRVGGNGRLLSLSRFLYMAQNPARFDPVVIAEMRGVIDDQGRSAFWDAVGKHFFDLDFSKADALSLVNKKFIADLMPRHPIYVPILPQEAQAVIGEVHTQTRPALELLKSEGFKWSGMVDIFEAGPVMVAKLEEIRSVRESVLGKVEELVGAELEEGFMHVLSPKEGAGSRCARVAVKVGKGGGLVMGRESAEGLEVNVGDVVRWATPR
jgi:arginine N-succinyltransferase